MPGLDRSAPVRRWVVRGGLAVVLGLLGVTLSTTGTAALASPPAVTAAQPSVVETAYGPLGPADRELLVRVRLAGLWEIPAGQLAEEKGSTEQIREIGHHISEEHIDLDQQVVEVAAELDVPLPDEPHADHQVWLNQLDRLTGEDFDQLFIQVLREAHGEIYPIIADVRAGTRNDLMREFAQVGEEFVGRHLNYLESAGLVDWDQLPPPSEPYGTQSRFLAASPAGVHPVTIWLLLGIATVTGVFTFIRTLRPR